MIDKEMLEILCCPLGKSRLTLNGENLICMECGLIYPIRNGIPVLLIDEARLPDGVKEICELKCQRGKDSNRSGFTSSPLSRGQASRE